MLYKIPLPKWRLPRRINLGRYFFLIVVAALIPFITAQSWFSRLCPAGALEGGVFLKAVPPAAPLPETGWFFWFKMAILGAFLLWMMVSKRPFCRAVCPLGAMWGLCNRVSLYRMAVDDDQVHRLREVPRGLPVDIDISEDPNSPDCVRCLACKKECRYGAISSGLKQPAEELRLGRRTRSARRLSVYPVMEPSRIPLREELPFRLCPKERARHRPVVGTNHAGPIPARCCDQDAVAWSMASWTSSSSGMPA